jgi:hypothetical protein
LALLVDLLGFGVALVLAFFCPLWLGLGLADGLALAAALLPEDFVDADCDAAVTVLAVWLNKFMKPTTPTALSSVARQVRVDSLCKPLSRRALSRSRCLMGANETGNCVKGPPRTNQGGTAFTGS